MSKPNPQPPPVYSCKQVAAGMILFCVILGIFAIFFSKGCSGNNQDNSKSLSNYAYIISTNYIKDYLKDPSSADFDYFTASPDVSLTNDVYTVKYHFNANNSFGVKTRSNYICDLKYLGSNPEKKESWKLKGLYIDGSIVAGNFESPEKNISNDLIKQDTLSKYYNIEKAVGNGYYLNVYVYLSDKSRLTQINNSLCKLYNDKYSQAIGIWYFDQKDIVDKYLIALKTKNISKAEFKKLDRHLIADWGQGKGQKGFMSMNN